MSEAAAMREWIAKPSVFVRQVLRVEEVDDWQDEVLVAAALGTEGLGLMRLALKASKGPGKSTVLAWLIWWFLTCFDNPKVVATSITGDNLKDGLWTELAKWQKRSELLQKKFTWNAERITCNESPETWWASARQWAKSADATKQADTLAGVHADNVLFVIDEAGGVPDAVAAAAEAGLANADPAKGKRALLAIAGNPTHLEGPLYRACAAERALWWVKEISGDPEDPKRAKRVSLQWAREQIEKYGRNDPWVLVNVFGKFPPGQSNALFGVEEVGTAAERTILPVDYEGEVRILGVDVARFGDDQTVLFKRQGRATFPPRIYRSLGTMQVVGEVSAVIDEWQPDAVFVDGTGVGAGVVDRLQQLNYQVIEVNNAEAALTPGKYADRRAEMWCLMLEWMRGGGAIPNDSELRRDLVAPTYWYDKNNHKRIESKKDLKARGLPSPDKADALALTFAAPVAHPDLRARTPNLANLFLSGTNLGRRRGIR